MIGFTSNTLLIPKQDLLMVYVIIITSTTTTTTTTIIFFPTLLLYFYIFIIFLLTQIISGNTQPALQTYTHCNTSTFPHAAGPCLHSTPLTNAPTPCSRDYHQSLTSFYVSYLSISIDSKLVCMDSSQYFLPCLSTWYVFFYLDPPQWEVSFFDHHLYFSTTTC